MNLTGVHGEYIFWKARDDFRGVSVEPATDTHAVAPRTKPMNAFGNLILMAEIGDNNPFTYEANGTVR